MFTVLTCLYRDHDYRLVGLAAAVCLISAWTCLSAHRRAQAASGGFRLGLLGLTAVVAAAGVWSTHFLAMLAYQPALNIRYDLLLTGASLMVAIGGFFIGFSTACLRPTLIGRLTGGALVGGAVAAMHFTGVAAMRLPATLLWDKGLVAAAVIMASAIAAIALAVGGSLSDRRRLIAATGLLVLAICSLHFTAMGAVTLLPNPGADLGAGAVSRGVLASQVAVFVVLILGAAGALLGLDRYSARNTLGSLKGALDAVPNALAFFDNRERLVFWNEPYARVLQIYGVRPEPGLDFRMMLTQARHRGMPSEGAPSGRAARFHERAAREFALPDGRWVRAELAPTRDGGAVVVMTEITDQRLAAATSAFAREQAEAANRTKSEFLANMSHEIRTPLNAVLGMAQVMERHPLAADQQQRLGVIRSSGESLLGLLNSILDISKIESGKMELEDRPFDLAQALATPCDAFAALTAQKEIAFSLTIAPDALGTWSGDAARLCQVVSNLLSNALKFTTEGEIGVTVARAPDGLSIAVRDTGVGIAADQLERIFDQFAQADSSTTRRFGGTGLGLSICKELVELMSGRIWAESHEGEGSTFAFDIPLRQADAVVQPRAVQAQMHEAAPRALRILAAEDNPTNRLILAALLEPLSVELVMAEDGLEAVDAFARSAFDVVLMDAQMPRMNGVEATQAIRAMEAERGGPLTPILALTANVMSHQVSEYLAAGMDGHVAKPIQAERLFQAIDAALSGSEEAPGADQAAA
ncbi:MAG: hypothetical protein JWP35_3709 [Caulobacter sp.]|nr:hypothetical protein [Caulobacter sp.]